MGIQASKLVTFNKFATLVWILLIAPTLLWWTNSILWVALMSIWANVASHFAAWIAARGEEAQKHGYNLTAADKTWLLYHIHLATTIPKHWSEEPTETLPIVENGS